MIIDTNLRKGYYRIRILLGAHLSIQGGLYKAVERAHESGCSVLQIFTHSPRQWHVSPVREKDPGLFKAKLGNLLVASHSSYLINLVSANRDVRKKSLNLLIRELKRTKEFTIPYLILHPGSVPCEDEIKAVQDLARRLDAAIEESGNENTKILLETTAGHQGSIGYKFEHLRDIIDFSHYQDNIGVCFDTCHAFAAGYDIRNRRTYNQTIETFHNIIGIRKLNFFHLNDSKNRLGSRVDRHTHIGRGEIGIKAFSYIMNDRRFQHTGKCIETPKKKGDLWDRINLSLLQRMVRK